jgi:hypothetical protein
MRTMKHLTLIVPIFLIGLMLVIPAARADQTTLFFDDFVTSQLSSSWDVQSLSSPLSGNVSQSGGYLTLVDGAAYTKAVASNPALIAVAADNIGKSTYDSNVAPNTFEQLVFKLQAFNFSNNNVASTGSGVRNAELDFGLALPGVATGFAFGSFGFVGWKLVESDLSSSGQAMFKNKQSIGIQMYPNAITGQMFCSLQIIQVAPLDCVGPSINYDGNQQIDLNSQHIFTMDMNINFQDTSKMWIAFQVDGDGWTNVTQTACNCITPTSTALVPFLELGYCMGTTANAFSNPHCASVTPSQSMATNIDYVLLSNYPVANLPQGQLLSSGANPPTSQQPLGVNTFSITQFIQFQANSLTPGNVFAGGMALAGLIILMWAGVVAIVVKKTQGGVKEWTLLSTFGMLGIVFFFYYCQVLPVWVPVGQVIITMGGFILWRSSSGGSGGIPSG